MVVVEDGYLLAVQQKILLVVNKII